MKFTAVDLHKKLLHHMWIN